MSLDIASVVIFNMNKTRFRDLVRYVAHDQIQYEIFICGEGGTSDPNLEAR